MPYEVFEKIRKLIFRFKNIKRRIFIIILNCYNLYLAHPQTRSAMVDQRVITEIVTDTLRSSLDFNMILSRQMTSKRRRIIVDATPGGK